MDGIILINKEKHITSHDVVYNLRKILKEKKCGHTGTLDPLATGLLIILFGKYTKLSSFLYNDTKTYDVKILFGIQTNTLDVTGDVIERKFVNKIDNLDNVLKSIKGEIEYYPPMFSAIKINGKKLYSYARMNIEVERKLKKSFIYDVIKLDDLEYENDFAYLNIRLKVSSGTYIRSIVDIIGKRLDFPCTVYDLCRIEIGDLKLCNSYNLTDIINNNYKFIDCYDLLKIYYEIVKVDKETALYLKNGREFNHSKQKDKIAVFCENDIIGIYQYVDNKYKALRIWN